MTVLEKTEFSADKVNFIGHKTKLTQIPASILGLTIEGH
jgi:hypothetical protein